MVKSAPYWKKQVNDTKAPQRASVSNIQCFCVYVVYHPTLNVISVYQLRNLLITFAITLTYNYKWLASNSVHFPTTLNWRVIVTIQITNLYNWFTQFINNSSKSLRSLVCCSPWGVTKSQTWPSDWTTITDLYSVGKSGINVQKWFVPVSCFKNIWTLQDTEYSVLF